MLRDSFVKRFGEDQADAIEMAAVSHMNDVHDDAGSDVFRWSILMCIGYQCMELDDYRRYHGITAPWNEIQEWMQDNISYLRDHDGDVDYLGLFCGAYNFLATENN